MVITCMPFSDTPMLVILDENLELIIENGHDAVTADPEGQVWSS